MLSLNKDKAPGPDDYNAMFFHQAWSIVGNLTIKAISEFFRNGKLLGEANSTYISLVPKCQNPSTINDYRPISCCNTIYKCISKLLANKLQLVLPHIIDHTQTAFVQGRKITDSVLLTHELLRVKWEFTLDCLSHLNFPPRFIKLIQACITSPSFTVAINGEFKGFFTGKRGLRQGDPISPFLFVIIMDIFTSTVKNIISRTPRFRYHWRCKELGITHLSFADDLFLFCHGDITSVSILKSALDHFCTMSGLSINLSKSSIFLSGVDPSTEATISNLLGINKGYLPIRHLGVPLISTCLRAADCRPLIERITHMITHWTSRSLSYACRLQLIKSVLVSTQVYWSSIFILPKGVFDEINRILMAFLWSGIEMKSTNAKIAWMDICKPKEAGGLGIPNLVISNQAAIIRYIWDLTDNSDRVWIKWCKTYLIKGKNLWALEIPQSCSWSWRKLLQQRHYARNFIKHQVGNGMSTCFWYDNWLLAGPLSTRFPSQILTAAGLDLSTTVSHFISGGTWNFPASISSAIPELLVLGAPNNSGNDKLIWAASPSGSFSHKHTAALLSPSSPSVSWFNLVWRSPAIPRMKFIMWLAIQGRLPTLDRRSMARFDNLRFCPGLSESVAFKGNDFFTAESTKLSTSVLTTSLTGKIAGSVSPVHSHRVVVDGGGGLNLVIGVMGMCIRKGIKPNLGVVGLLAIRVWLGEDNDDGIVGIAGREDEDAAAVLPPDERDELRWAKMKLFNLQYAEVHWLQLDTILRRAKDEKFVCRNSPSAVLDEIKVIKDAELAGNGSFGIFIDRPMNRILVSTADVREYSPMSSTAAQILVCRHFTSDLAHYSVVRGRRSEFSSALLDSGDHPSILRREMRGLKEINERTRGEPKLKLVVLDFTTAFEQFAVHMGRKTD
ncbi:uncharacterized protein LOC132305432 [Cornus florida]|uniref:uncharacterized protein LOC132305432 n=1 Tax=Cornus florida TaxID=4283 RepID=UPI002896490D|nr:uncharacterized protein LOC132305432 [Cornus florida]